MKKGDKVICTTDTNFQGLLTVGKQYEVIEGLDPEAPNDNMIVVISDQGKRTVVFARRFKPVPAVKHRLTIESDSDYESPREWDNLGTMFCQHGRYRLGDSQAKDIRDDENRLPRTGYTILPLYLYDHSGITMRTTPFSCPWDSGQVGVIYVSDKKARAEYGWKLITKKRRELLRTYLRNEVEVYDQYLRGDVYRYTYEEISVDQHGVETVIEQDSCCGFYGRDPKENGIADQLPAGVSLSDCEVAYS